MILWLYDAFYSYASFNAFVKLFGCTILLQTWPPKKLLFHKKVVSIKTATSLNCSALKYIRNFSIFRHFITHKTTMRNQFRSSHIRWRLLYYFMSWCTSQSMPRNSCRLGTVFAVILAALHIYHQLNSFKLRLNTYG